MKKVVIKIAENNRQKIVLTIFVDNLKLNNDNIVKKRSKLDYWI